MKLQQITSDQLRQGMVIIYFAPLAIIYVGRIHDHLKRYHMREAAHNGGILAEFDLLQADQHKDAGDLIWDRYFHQGLDAPRECCVFAWPRDLMRLSFEKGEVRLKTHPGWLVHLQITV